LLFAYAPAGYGIAWGAEESQVKKDCISLGGEGIKEILKKLNVPDAKVLGIADSPIKGVCEVVIEIVGQTKIFYLDADKNYLILGSLVEVANMSNKTVEAIQRIQDKKRIDTAKIPLANALILGKSGAAKKAVVFTDPDCPFCGQLHQTMKQIVAKRKDIAFYIKFLPLDFHKEIGALPEAELLDLIDGKK
jgi:thiol:disulfide interchange protein DsbC